jgi:hypothetical protein
MSPNLWPTLASTQLASLTTMPRLAINLYSTFCGNKDNLLSWVDVWGSWGRWVWSIGLVQPKSLPYYAPSFVGWHLRLGWILALV